MFRCGQRALQKSWHACQTRSFLTGNHNGFGKGGPLLALSNLCITKGHEREARGLPDGIPDLRYSIRHTGSPKAHWQDVLSANGDYCHVAQH